MMAERKRDHSRPWMWLARLKHHREGMSWTAPLSGLPGTLSRGHGMELAAYIVELILLWRRLSYLLSAHEPWGNTLTTN